MLIISPKCTRHLLHSTNKMPTLSSFMKYFSSKQESNEESPLKKLVEESSSFLDTHSLSPQQQWATLPYPKGTNTKSEKELKPKVDPRDTSFILFPGQGTQYVGMAKDLLKFPMARDLFELSNYILGYDILKICLEGPKEKLDQTKFCQPAIMICSLAAIERLKEERPNAIENCVATAGFSLGEITSLVFSGALGFEIGKKYFLFNVQIILSIFIFNEFFLSFKVSKY